MIKSGIYSSTELSSEAYHEDKGSYSRTQLMTFNKSPFHFWAKYLNPERPKKDASKAMALGSAFHTFILEPEFFGENYIISPEKVLLKDVGREAYDYYKLQCDNLLITEKTIITMAEFDTLVAMQESLMRNEQAKDLLRDGIIEQSYFWTDKESGLMVKSRPDIMHSNMYVDLKTCSDASPRAYQREMIDYGYHWQGAMLRDAIRACEGREMSTVINVCVETKYPYMTAIYIIDEAAIDYAEKQYKSALLELRECIEADVWLGYGIATIGMPSWAIS